MRNSSRSQTTRAELARRLGWHREQVDRLFRLDHASRLDRLKATFKALHREMGVEIIEAAPSIAAFANDQTPPPGAKHRM